MTRDLQKRRSRIERVNAKRPAQPPSPLLPADVVVRLRVADRRSLEALVDALGSLAADLWLDGLLDL